MSVLKSLASAIFIALVASRLAYAQTLYTAKSAVNTTSSTPYTFFISDNTSHPLPNASYYVVPLSDHDQVPRTGTSGYGLATFEFGMNDSYLVYKLYANNVKYITQAHIHLGFPGTTGGVLAWLFPLSWSQLPDNEGVEGTGLLASSRISSSDLSFLKNATGGNLTSPTSLSGLRAVFNAGGAYVNVHTTSWPAGEIRGNIGPLPPQ